MRDTAIPQPLASKPNKLPKRLAILFLVTSIGLATTTIVLGAGLKHTQDQLTTIQDNVDLSGN